MSGPSDAVELARLIVAALEEKVQLISKVDDIASAKSIANQLQGADRRHRHLSEKAGRQLKTAAQEGEIESLYGSRRKDLERQWNEHWLRVGQTPGALESLYPELAPYADTNPIPEDAAELEREAARLFAIMLEQSRKVHDVRSALEASPRYRAAAARFGIVRSRLRRALDLRLNDPDPPAVHAANQQLDQERKRIRSIVGAAYAFANGEQQPIYDGALASAAAATAKEQPARVVQESVPSEFQGLVSQEGVLIIPRGLRDPRDEQQISRLLTLRNPSITRSFGHDGQFALAPVPDLNAFLATIDFAEVAVDRRNRVVVLDLRYPLPSASKTAIETLEAAIATGDHVAIGNACLRISSMEPDANRGQVGRYMLDLMPYEATRSIAAGVIQKGWISQEQVPQAREIVAQLDDRGLAALLGIGISRLPDLDSQSLEFLASFLEISPFHATEILRNAGRDAEPFVHPYLNHARVDVRKEACHALSFIGTERSLPVLEQALQDENRAVADMAQHAIREIGKR